MPEPEAAFECTPIAATAAIAWYLVQQLNIATAEDDMLDRARKVYASDDGSTTQFSDVVDPLRKEKPAKLVRLYRLDKLGRDLGHGDGMWLPVLDF